MALILRYRVDPPEAINQEVYESLASQVGDVGLNIQCPIGDGATVQLVGQFISVEGEHAVERGTAPPTPEGDGPRIGPVRAGEEFPGGEPPNLPTASLEGGNPS